MQDHSGRDETEKLLAMAAHDLRAPLRQISLQIALMRRRRAAELTDGVREDLEAVQEQAKVLQDLLEDMLNWVAGNPREDASIFSVDAVLSNVRKMLQQELVDRDAILAWEFTGCEVRAREKSALRLLLNLVRNALEHGGKGVKITISCEHIQDRVRVSVTDTGPGIPEHLRAGVFEPFNRGAAHSHTHGTGLGLAICKRLAEEEGGQVGVDAAPTGGSRFWFELPAGC